MMAIDWKERFSGYQYNRLVTPEGELRKETHSYGMLKIGLMIEYANGQKVGETYFVNKRMATRAKYEKARVAYEKMPAADSSGEDPNVEFLKAVSRERREGRKRLKVHKPDIAAGRKLDAFCRELIQKESSADAAQWIRNPKATLGELSRSASRAMVDKLLDKGAVRVYACEICREPGLENTGHVVVELPEASDARMSILKIAGNWAMKLGFDPTPDYGQSMVYIKLD